MTARPLPRAAPQAAEPAEVAEPFAAEFPAAADAGPPFERRDPERRTTALVVASAHSGRLYPAELMRASGLDAHRIRRSEDALVDRLVAAAPGCGAPLLLARHARAYVDLNRAPDELDPGMFADGDGRACVCTPRAAAGLGAVPRVVGEGCEIYRSPPLFAEAQARLDRVHGPWHRELDGLMDAAAARFGCAVLLDVHSMPAAAVAGPRGPGPELVLGDRHGASASPAVAGRVEAVLRAAGWTVARNRPYAGGYVCKRQGRPAGRRHALQLEIRRDLYLDEARLQPGPGFARVRGALGGVLAVLAATDWAALA